MDNIIELCRQHTDFQTNQHLDLSNRLKITKRELIANISYHAGCYRQFSTSKNYIVRAKAKKRKSEDGDSSNIAEKSKTPTADRRLSRSRVPPYDMNKCILCQTNVTGQSVHEIMQQSNDTELKNALADSSLTLNLVRIHYERSHARADVKYHNQCWAENIVRRTPDFPTIIDTPSSSSDDVTVSDNLPQTHNDDLHSDNTEVVRNIIMEEIVQELRTALSIWNIYTVRQSVEAYDKQARI